LSDDFNRRILEDVDHRPWPLPVGPWIMRQTWHDLLFAHWPVDARAIASLIPPEFPLDTFESRAWLGVVPFRMSNVAPRGVPALPWLSEFPELNVRTYVRVGDKPGVFFFSLDASNSLAVAAAFLSLRLPYYTATMHVEPDADGIRYRSRRASSRRPAELTVRYAPAGETSAPTPGSFEYFLTERYCLYARHHLGRPYRLEIHHPPWPLQPATAELSCNTMTRAAGIHLPAVDPVLHFAKRQDMVAWGPTFL
jgi:uncharacterized protein YqjF (DUF2071 family)